MLLTLLANLGHAGGTAAPPVEEPEEITGGNGAIVRERDVALVDAMLTVTGRIRATGPVGVASGYGMVANPVPVEAGPVPELGTVVITGAVMGYAMAGVCESTGSVGLGDDELEEVRQEIERSVNVNQFLKAWGWM